MENAFNCPITQQLMRDPVIAGDGHTYERAAIEQWLREHGISPITREPLDHRNLLPNRALRTAIEAAHPEEAPVAPARSPEPARRSPPPAEVAAPGGNGLRLCLVLDTSGSMGSAAPPPDGKEDAGFSVLDIVKHSCNTIISTLGNGDSVSVVQFNSKASSVLPPTKMDERGKRKAIAAIGELDPTGDTALWQGLLLGLETDSTILLLTDGQPTRDPPSGSVALLREWRAKAQARRPDKELPSVHAFGFGYEIDSDLLNALAAAGNGFFGFIPDSSMIGTVFVSAAVWLRPALRTPPRELAAARAFTVGLRKLTRRAAVPDLQRAHEEVRQELLAGADCPARDAFLQNWEDQVAKAVSREDWYSRWGRSYLLSLARAVELQISANFRDPAGSPFETPAFLTERQRAEKIFVDLPPVAPTGPFAPQVAPAAPPAMDHYLDRHGGCFYGNIRVQAGSKWEERPAGSVRRGDRVWALHETLGWLWSEVECVMKSAAGELLQSRDGGCLVTPWHPVRADVAWVFPINATSEFARPVAHVDHIEWVYSFALYPPHGSATRPTGVLVGTTTCATLAHGNHKDSVLRHPFFGTEAVITLLRDGCDCDGVATVTGFVREAAQGAIHSLMVAAQ